MTTTYFPLLVQVSAFANSTVFMVVTLWLLLALLLCRWFGSLTARNDKPLVSSSKGTFYVRFPLHQAVATLHMGDVDVDDILIVLMISFLYVIAHEEAIEMKEVEQERDLEEAGGDSASHT